MIQIPNRFTKFFLEWDSWRNQWQSFAMVEMRDVSNTFRWYKGIGPNPDLASKDLYYNINNGITIETVRDKNRVEELSKQSKSKGFRALEEAKLEKKTYEENQPKLKDLF